MFFCFGALLQDARLYQSKYAEPAFQNLLNLIFLKIVGRILAFYNDASDIQITFWFLLYFTIAIDSDKDGLVV